MFTRGHVTLDFTGHTVTAQGVEHAKHNDPFGALFHFTGVPGDDVRTFPLAQPMRELYDVFEVPGAGVVDTLIHSIMRIKGVQRAFRINN